MSAVDLRGVVLSRGSFLEDIGLHFMVLNFFECRIVSLGYCQYMEREVYPWP